MSNDLLFLDYNEPRYVVVMRDCEENLLDIPIDIKICNRGGYLFMERYRRYNGKKVYLTALAMCDAKAIAKWHNDPEVAQYCIDFREMKSLLTVQDEVAEMIKSGEAFAIFDKTTDRIIGCSWGCSILMGEKDYWHKGYDVEALEFLKEFCFNIRNWNIATVSAFSHDIRALEAYAEAGFKKTCVYRQRLIRGRNKYDEIHMDLLSTEYWATQKDKEGAE